MKEMRIEYVFHVGKPQGKRRFKRWWVEGEDRHNSKIDSKRKLHNLYASPDIVRVMTSRRMGWAG